jgi:hypothetical protein
MAISRRIKVVRVQSNQSLNVKDGAMENSRTISFVATSFFVEWVMFVCCFKEVKGECGNWNFAACM